jgi:hypothetical protein
VGKQLYPERSEKEREHRRPYRYSRKQKVSGAFYWLREMVNAYRIEQMANREQNNRQDKEEKSIEKWTLSAITVTAILVLIQDCILNKTDNTMRESFEGVQRAFVNVTDLRHREIINEGDREHPMHIFTPIIKNAGNTSARNVIIYVFGPGTSQYVDTDEIPAQDYRMIEATINAPQDVETYIRNPRAGKAIIKNATIGPQSEINDDNFNMLVWPVFYYPNSNYGRFVYGMVNYDDVFTKRHISKFCFRVDLEGQENGKLTQEKHICSHWNCTDSDCNRDKQEYDADYAAAVASFNEQKKKH